jgi:hypothetical protein
MASNLTLPSNSTDLNATDLLPWSWSVGSPDAKATCPSTTSTLLMFLAVNGIVAIGSLVFGNRIVVKKITHGIMGTIGSKSWRWMWLVVLSLHLIANTLNAWLIKNATGYDSSVSLGELMLFFATRPRVSWLVLGFLSSMPRPSKSLDERYGITRGVLPSHDQEERGMLSKVKPRSFAKRLRRFFDIDLTDTKNLRLTRVLDFPFFSSAASAILAELILQTLSLVVMGRTVHFAARRGYYVVWSQGYQSLPSSATLMYSGAMLCIVSGPILLMASLGGALEWFERMSLDPKTRAELCLERYRKLKLHEPGIRAFFKREFSHSDDDDDNFEEEYTGSCVGILGIFYSIGLWLFWAGFLDLAGRL